MEHVAAILTSPNAFLVLSALIVLVILIAYFSKKGLFSYKGKGLAIGMAEKERTIIRQQIEYCQTETKILTNQMISHHPDADEWRVKYICELIYDIYIESISYNHITKDSFYIDNKFDKIWAVVLKETKTEDFHNEEFKSVMYKECKKVIERLVDIREYYSN